MNTHLLVILAELVALLGVAALFAFYAAVPARAQSRAFAVPALPPPPAYAIALRLLVRGDFQYAVEKLQEVEDSAAYRNTPYAPEAAYLVAHIYRDNLHDNAQAMAAYARLVTTYGLYPFPHKAAATAERQALGRTMDAANARHPLYRLLDFFVRLTGARSYSYATALLLISVLVRLTLMSLTLRQYKGMREMQALQPAMQRLQAKHKADPTRLREEVQKLQQEHGVNPMAGCLMGLLQAPIFYAMYQAVLLYQYHFSGGTFLWIGNRFAAAHPQFLALNLGLPDILLLALYATSMYLTQRLVPVGDPDQAQMQKTTAWVMPLLYCFWIGTNHTASAFVLYWLISNVLSTATQFYHLRPRPNAPVAA